MTQRRHRVLYIENTSGVGGSTVSLRRLVHHLDNSRYEPVVLFHNPNHSADHFRQLGVEVLHLNYETSENAPAALTRPRDIAAWLQRYSLRLAQVYRELKEWYLFLRESVPAAWRIFQIIRRQHIDLVHVNNMLSSHRAGVLAAWCSRTPCVCHVRDFDRPALFDAILARGVSDFVFMSRMLEEDTRRQLPVSRGTVIYDGLDFDRSAPAPAIREQFGLAADDFVIGNVGRLTPWKGQDVFLRALALVRPHLPRLKALIVGQPDPLTETAYLERLQTLRRDLGLEEVVVFTGFQPDIPAVMSALDLLVHSASSPEPFGIVILEGMAAGKPVIATLGGGVPDMIEHAHNGWLIPVGEAQSMAEAILTLAQDSALAQRLGVQAQHRVEAKFSAAQFARSVETIYARLIGRPQLPASKQAAGNDFWKLRRSPLAGRKDGGRHDSA